MAAIQGALLGILAGVQLQAAPVQSPGPVDHHLRKPAHAQVIAPEKSDEEKARERACDAAQRIDLNQKRLDQEKEYAKVGGMMDKEKVYRASRGIVEGRRELTSAMSDYKEITGKDYSEKDIRACDYFQE